MNGKRKFKRLEWTTGILLGLISGTLLGIESEEMLGAIFFGDFGILLGLLLGVAIREDILERKKKEPRKGIQHQKLPPDYHSRKENSNEC